MSSAYNNLTQNPILSTVLLFLQVRTYLLLTAFIKNRIRLTSA
jgi:hypothetical protein